MTNSSVAVRLKALRSRLGMTQSDFAQTYYIPITTVRNYEQAHRSNPPAALSVLIHLIDTDPDGVAEMLRTKPPSL